MAVRPSGVQHCIRGDCIVYCTQHCTRTLLDVLEHFGRSQSPATTTCGSLAATLHPPTAWLLCTLKAISRVWSLIWLDRVEGSQTLFLVYFVAYVHIMVMSLLKVNPRCYFTNFEKSSIPYEEPMPWNYYLLNAESEGGVEAP